jgi:signal peptidase I
VNTDLDFIKRVVGVSGDTIEIFDKVVHVNGQPVATRVESEDYLFFDQDRNSTQWFPREATLVRELLNGTPHLTLRNRGDPAGAHEGPFQVPPEHIFVMGDNRDNSTDSRFDLGGNEVDERGNPKVRFVPYGNIKGKAMVIWLSLSYGGLGSSMFGGTGLRTDRLFQPVQMCGLEPPRHP